MPEAETPTERQGSLVGRQRSILRNQSGIESVPGRSRHHRGTKPLPAILRLRGHDDMSDPRLPELVSRERAEHAVLKRPERRGPGWIIPTLITFVFAQRCDERIAG